MRKHIKENKNNFREIKKEQLLVFMDFHAIINLNLIIKIVY